VRAAPRRPSPIQVPSRSLYKMIKTGRFVKGLQPGLPRTAVIGVIGAALGGHGAAAQVIDAYLPPIGGGMDSMVLGRPQPLYASPGVNLGSFVIRPLLRETFGYDSNPQAITGGRGSPLIEDQAAISANSNWVRNSLAANLSVDKVNYTTLPIQNATNWTAAVAGTYDIGSDKLFASFAHQSMSERPGQIGAVNLTQPLAYTVDDYRLGYNFNTAGRFSLSPDVDYSTYSFGSSAGSTATLIDNRAVLQEELVSRYEFSTLRYAVLVLRGTEISYNSLPAGTPSPNSIGGTVLAGLDYAAAGVFRYRILVGYQVRKYASRDISSLSAPTVEASVIWTPTRLTTVTATLRNDIQDAADQSITGFTYTAGRLSVDHELRRNVLLNAFGDIQHGAFPSTKAALANTALAQNAGSQNTYAGGVGVTVLLNRNVRLSARYVLSEHSASGVGATGAYSDNTAIVSFEFRL
jgi:hypothetical protein